jgi:hypothetical protein
MWEIKMAIIAEAKDINKEYRYDDGLILVNDHLL